MKIRTAVALAVCVATAGCQTTPQEAMIWVRTDGHRLADNPTYSTQFQVDKTVCVGEVQKSAAGAPVIYYRGLAGAIDASIIQQQHQTAYADIMKGCMAGKGYVLVPVSQAPAVSANFKAAAARKSPSKPQGKFPAPPS